jgi:hypothetical protein
MSSIYSQFPVRRLGMSVIASAAALCLLLAMTTAVLAGTVSISDQAGVLNKSQVQSAASSLPYPISIYTTNNFQGTSSDFDQRASSHLTSPNMIVIAIDTVHKHLAIVGGSNVPLSSGQYNDAVQAFKNSFNSGDYTGATIAAIRSLQNSLSSAPASGSNTGSRNTPAPAGGLFGGIGTTTLCCIGLLVLAALALFGFFRRRSGGGLFGRNPTMAPPPPYNPYNQPYPPNYGPGYGPQGGGIGPLGAGGLGAAAGGFIGYELGKEAGEREAQQGGYQGDNPGGNSGGGDFGGGASGDFGGGGGGFGGGDFGGGGGGDFGGGGGGGSSGDF